MELEPKIYTGKYNAANNTWSWLPMPYMWNDEKIYYVKCDGLEAKGKVKNVYTETYADSGIVRTDFPTVITREAVDVTLTVALKHEDGADPTQRHNLGGFDSFIAYLTNGLTVFWDSVRRKAAVLLLTDTVKPSKDTYLGMNYLTADIKFSNIKGESFLIDDTFTDGHLSEVETAMQQIITQALS